MPLSDIFTRALQSLRLRKKEEEDKKKIIESLDKPVYNQREFTDTRDTSASNKFINALKEIRKVAQSDSSSPQFLRTGSQKPNTFTQSATLATAADSGTGVDEPATGDNLLSKVRLAGGSVFNKAKEAYFNAAEPQKGQPIRNVAKSFLLTPKGEAEEQARLLSSDVRNLGPEERKKVIQSTSNMAMGLTEPLAGGEGSLVRAAPKVAIENLDDVAKSVKRLSYEPAKNLDKAGREVEERFGKFLNENFDTAIEEYRGKFGNVINTDNVRELSPDYNANRALMSPAVHEPASSFAKQMYKKALEEAPGPGQNNEVLFTAGGTGAGKSTAINTRPEFKTTADKAQIVYDTNMNTYASSKQKVEQALKAGKDVKILYVLRDPVDAMVEGAAPRAMRMGRTVPLEAHVDTHVGALETIKKLADEYATNKNVQIGVIDNSYGRGGARVIPLESLKNVSYNKDEIGKNVKQALENLYNEQKITPEVYKGFTGEEAAKSQALGSGNGGQPQPPNQRAVELGEDQKLRSTSPPKFEASLKYYDTPDQVKQTIEQLANDTIDNVQKQRRGAISFKETRSLADALGMDVSDLEKRRPGEIWNAEQADAATRLMIGVNEKLTEVSSQIKKIREAGQEIPEELQLQQIDLASQAQAVTASILGDNAEAGRALNIRKMLKSAMETGDAKAQKNALKMFAGDKQRAKEVIAKLSEFEPDDNLGRAKFLRQVKPSTPLEKIEEYWYNSVLSNTATHVVNSVSNSVASLLSIPEKVVAGSLDASAEASLKVLGKAYKRDRYVAEAAAEAAGLGQGIKKGARKAMYVMRNGMSEANVSKMELGKGQAIKGVAGELINIPSRALVAEDEFFKGINYEMELHALATRMAKQEGLKGADQIARVAKLLSEPTPQMIANATKKSEYKAFQSQSNMASGLRYFRDMVKVDIPKVGEFRPLRFIIPFIQTPVNVVKYGLERSPAGFVGTAHKLAASAPKGEVLDSASRAIVGSTLMVPLAMYFTEGKIIGAPPKNRVERDAFYADGKIPYSVKIGNEWIAYNRIEPLNTVLTQLAMWHDAHNNGDETTVEQISNFLRSEARNVADQTFMTGVGNLVDAIEDPERYGQKFITDILGGFVPSLVAAGARASDKSPRLPETIGQSFKARIPGLSKEVPAIPSEIEPGGEAIRYTNEGPLRNFSSNFLGFRSTEDQGTNYQEQVKTIRAADQQTRDRKEKISEEATSLLQEVKDTPPDERSQLIEKKITEGTLTEEVGKKLAAEAKKESQSEGLNTEAKILKDYPNETKARYLYDKLKAMPVEDRESWVRQLLDQKIITESTIEELAKISQERKKSSVVENSLIAP